MAPPLIALRQAGLAFDRQPLFRGVNLSLSRGDHACLVGRNGSGKSTLLRVLAGTQDVDSGERFLQPGTSLAYLPQAPEVEDPAFAPALRCADYLRSALSEEDEPQGHKVDALLAAVDLDAERTLGTLSGGEARRAAIARCLLIRPQVLLLDEPTNHLDIPTVEWLESELSGFRGAILMISHDRTFLEKTVRQTYWLDRGNLRCLDQPYSQFEAWSQRILADEEEARHKLGRRIAREEHWLTHGVTARRRRNQGRLRQLQDLRRQRAEWLSAPGKAKLGLAAAPKGGDLVIEAKDLEKAFTLPDGRRRTIIDGFTTRIQRRDRIGIVGANGSGKTTLARLLMGELEPDGGLLRHGHGLSPIFFDQKRETLDIEVTLWETLAPDGGDSVMVQGHQRHVVSYLRDFLFAESQARQPVKSLSGGERSRLLFARLFARPANLIVLDEPTNDLDMETLDLLEAVLAEFDGTLMMVSHDRDFLDRLATGIILLEGDGRAIEYAGGYSDAMKQRLAAGPAPAEKKAAGAPKRNRVGRQGTRPSKLSYKDQRELDGLPQHMETLQREIDSLLVELADPELYQRDPAGYVAASESLTARESALRDAEERWLELESLRENLATGALGHDA